MTVGAMRLRSMKWNALRFEWRPLAETFRNIPKVSEIITGRIETFRKLLGNRQRRIPNGIQTPQNATRSNRQNTKHEPSK
jgi:hypothetical protein